MHNPPTTEPKSKPATRQAGAFFGGGAMPYFQPKLTVNQPGDAYEQEADHIADKVMRMREGDAPVVQRMFAPAIQRACAHCEEKRQEEEGVQRKETGSTDTGGQSAPSIVSDVLSSGGGQAMDANTQGFMSSRMGADFSNVRIHTDGKAAESASAIQARAYTSGNNIVFGQGEYQPGTEEGKRLLAHELVHVGQQGGGEVRRDAAPRSSVSVEVDEGPDSCSLEQHREIFPAILTAKRWTDRTISRLQDYISSASSHPAVSNALNRHFHATDTRTAERIARRLGFVSREIGSSLRGTGGAQIQSSACHDDTDTTCSLPALAYVRGGTDLVLCPDFFDDSTPDQAATILHELLHVSIGTMTHVTDRAYRHNRAYTHLTTIETLTNAASYENLCRELFTNTILDSTAPRDSMNDCDDRQSILMHRSMASLERWVGNTLNKLLSSNPRSRAGWQDLQTKYMGGTGDAQFRAATAAFRSVDTRLNNGLSFECEQSCDQNTTGYYRYFLFFTSDTLHVCPVIFSMNEDNRTHEMLSLIMMRYAGLSNQVAANYAHMAKEVHNRSWAPPATLTGFDPPGGLMEPD